MKRQNRHELLKTLIFPAQHVNQLYEYVRRIYYDSKGRGGVFNNRKGKYIGLFGHVKMMEAHIYLYRATKNQKYLDDFLEKMKVCLQMRTQNGVEDWWTPDGSLRSGWIESNHSGILALVIYEYWRATGDSRFNQVAEELMNTIPKVSTSGGAYVDGFDPMLCQLDNRCYLADNAEILAGWWACWKLTGKKEYQRNYEGIFAFFDQHFKTTEKQPDLPTWLVGPKHVKYAEGTGEEVYCDQSHTTYSQFFIARDIMLTGQRDQYQRLVQSVDWALRYALFDDHLIGYNERDDKMVGWSAYFVTQCYWAYQLTGADKYYRQAQRTMDAIWALQDKKTGRVIPYIPVKRKIDWRTLESNRAGLGEIWQLSAILESMALLLLSANGEL
jgi:hypothetical protein